MSQDSVLSHILLNHLKRFIYRQVQFKKVFYFPAILSSNTRFLLFYLQITEMPTETYNTWYIDRDKLIALLDNLFGRQITRLRSGPCLWAQNDDSGSADPEGRSDSESGL